MPASCSAPAPLGRRHPGTERAAQPTAWGPRHVVARDLHKDGRPGVAFMDEKRANRLVDARPARPRVLIHYAQTLDGRIATSTGSSRWISGDESLRFAHELRAAHDAVLVGIGTALADDPRLTVRHAEGPDPLKVVLDSTLRLPSTAALLRETPTRTVLITTKAASERDLDRVTASGALVLIAASEADGRVDLADGLRQLAAIGVGS